ncbi:pantoate--beta-alanine ligase [Tepidibacillus marianensis]|uniref:pantoate--beta-alanine ligase n=1 Tax=Tepidibacillus marianensis TaxID=3131995 RepID=UPI0030D39110
MEIISSIQQIRLRVEDEKKEGIRIGLIPTMGFLHRGHQSLIERARKECDIVIVSIFVNPIQFGPNEDYGRYPRNMARDKAVAKEAGADLIFAPTVEEIYPTQLKTYVDVNDLTSQLCGKSRPGHFRGVTTVVSKLFHIISPDRAYFGLKDAQQVAVITQMVKDLNFPVTIVACPLIREEDGLALSSRNVYLSTDEREQAIVLYQSLNMAKEMILAGEVSVERIKQNIKDKIKSQSLSRIDYIEVLSFPSLQEVNTIEQFGQTIIALAVWFGNTRLIDNLIFNANEMRE